MSEHQDTAQTARNQIANTVVGKAKEVFGAVTGNDEMVEEGRVRQEAARAQKQAAHAEAIAQSEEAAAAEKRREAFEADDQRRREAEENLHDDAKRITHDEEIIAQRTAERQEERLAAAAERIEAEEGAKLWKAAEHADKQTREADAERGAADEEYRSTLRAAADAADKADGHRDESAIYRQHANNPGKGH